MSLQTDINWIKTEIDKVSDPFFVETLKSLLNYRRQNQPTKQIDLEEVLISRALKSEDDITNGRLLSRAEMDRRTK